MKTKKRKRREAEGEREGNQVCWNKMKEDEEKEEAERGDMDERKEEEGKNRQREGDKSSTGWKMVTRKTEEERGERRKMEEEREKRQKWQTEQEEREKKKRNVWLRGEAKVEEIGIEEVEEAIRQGIGKTMKVARIVEKKQRGKDGMVVVEMREEDDKWELVERRKEMDKAGIEVNEDLTWWERSTRFKLMERATEERRKGKRVRIENRRIIVEGTVWRWDERNEGWTEHKEEGI